MQNLLHEIVGIVDSLSLIAPFLLQTLLHNSHTPWIRFHRHKRAAVAFQRGAAVFHHAFPFEEVETFAPQRIFPEALGKVNGIDKLAIAVEKGAELHNGFVFGL